MPFPEHFLVSLTARTSSVFVVLSLISGSAPDITPTQLEELFEIAFSSLLTLGPSFLSAL